MDSYSKVSQFVPFPSPETELVSSITRKGITIDCHLMKVDEPYYQLVAYCHTPEEREVLLGRRDLQWQSDDEIFECVRAYGSELLLDYFHGFADRHTILKMSREDMVIVRDKLQGYVPFSTIVENEHTYVDTLPWGADGKVLTYTVKSLKSAVFGFHQSVRFSVKAAPMVEVSCLVMMDTVDEPYLAVSSVFEAHKDIINNALGLGK